RQDSMESINEATQLYVLAAELLGPKPAQIPAQAKPPLESFNELEAQLDTFGNALVEVENLIPPPTGSGVRASQPVPLPTLYFCIPHNEKMLSYWDTVADRLYKIRHCMNIEGVVRQLALFEPPIDPGALVKAVAAGVDIGAAMADLSAPLPLYRFNVLLQKANEVCNDVKALGSALLSALEKKDGEALGLVRQGQEIRALEAVTAVREQQIEEAKENLEGMRRSKELAGIKREFYESREFMNTGESVAIALNTASTILDIPVSIGYITAGVLKLIPNFLLGASGFGGSPHVTAETGGNAFGPSAKFVAEGLAHIARNLDKMASLSSTIGSYKRRQEDWDFQRDLAVKETEQLERSIAATELRVAIAEKELDNHVQQIENAKTIDAFMRSKYTNEELYQWQVGQVSGVYFQSYRLALDLAKRAERCLRFELGTPGGSFISGGHWDSLKKGLLSGEKLQYDLRRLETAYLEENRRELELTKHVSLLQLDPLALVRLRETGRCFFQVPEAVFDLDYPGHYMRRIKSVSLTLPCVTGPYTTIPCTLRLLKNSVRINTGSGDNGYPRNTDDGLPADDPRFVENNIPVKAIAASSGQNDSGLFELNFRDERYLPFEGAGAVSEWSLELFNDLAANNPDPVNPDFGRPLRQFDYGTITDAVLHVKYTAREDAGVFKNGAVQHLRDHFGEAGGSPSLLLLDLRREFASEWTRFLNPTNPTDGHAFVFEMSLGLFPIRDAGRALKINSLHLLARSTDPGEYGVTLALPLGAALSPVVLGTDGAYGGMHVGQMNLAAASVEVPPTGSTEHWTLTVTGPSTGILADDLEDLVMVLGYESP
ncbi:MAG: neuraminidase-like domain-containing protein, partial [Actinomycetota bacterium]